MNGIIDTGGGLRGIYGAGVLDRCMRDDIRFDCAIGVSAGSANIAAFAGHQPGRNYAFYCEYSQRKEYMSFGNLLKTGSYIGLDYIYRTLSDSTGEDPLDYETLKAYPGELYVVATDALTGAPRYFTKNDFHRDEYGVICASCAIPSVCRAYPVRGTPYYDGGVSDPVPLSFALAKGCEKTVLILTRPTDFVMSSSLENLSAKLLFRRYPAVAAALKKRAYLYSTGVRRALALQEEGRCLVIAPDDCCGADTLTRDKEKLDRLYRKGYEDAGKIKTYLEKSL